jgi:phage tail tube protein FII
MNSDRLIQEPTKRTPWIILEPGRIFMVGRSIPDDPTKFYNPLLTWITDHASGFPGKITIDMGFEYINTASTKWIYILLKEMSNIKNISLNASVNWYYEHGDEDLHELGFILRSLVNCPFKMIEVPEMNQETYEKIMSRSF